MARWEPDARARLVGAALDLFNERGYDETTVAQIAERAGLTKSTFFRHFPDKRDVLAAGQDAMAQLLRDGIAAAPADATPLAAVCSGLMSVSVAFTSITRELAPKLKAAIAASAELQQRNALKQIGLAAAMAEALQARGVPDVDGGIGRRTRLAGVQNGLCALGRAGRGTRSGHHRVRGVALVANRRC